jgi:hypothetical protein
MTKLLQQKAVVKQQKAVVKRKALTAFAHVGKQ